MGSLEKSMKLTNPNETEKGEKREKSPISDIRNETVAMTTDPENIQRIIREYCLQLYINFTT